MRPAPKHLPAAITRRAGSTKTHRVSVVLLTPLFGGGAVAREPDARSWLRASAVKSAIRGWWRAGHAHHFSDLKELHTRESLLFGSPARYRKDGAILGGPGKVSVEVSASAPAHTAFRSYESAQGDALNVAYFPAAPIGQAAARLLHPDPSVSADVILKLDSVTEAEEQEVLQALRLWLVLGGAGARTRRGAGALGVASKSQAAALGVPNDRSTLTSFLRSACARRTCAQGLDGVPCLARTRSVFIGRGDMTPEEAHRQLLTAVREVRQWRPHPANWRGASEWGQSRWPEPDAIRIKEGGTYEHSPKPANARKFPRAALGLPIVVKFKSANEPQVHHILAAIPGERAWSRLDRYASPLIVRPVRVWNGDSTAHVPVAVLMDCTLARGARALVTRRPTASPPLAADVFDSYSIAADTTAAERTEAVLGAPASGFTKLQETTR